MNRKDKTELLITVLLIGVFILMAAGLLGKLQGVRKAPSYPANTSVSKKSLKGKAFKSRTVLSAEVTQKIEEAAKILIATPDPFRDRPLDASGNSGLVLQGISWGEKESLALINDQALKEGDVVQDYRVKKINKESVVLDNGSRVLTLALP